MPFLLLLTFLFQQQISVIIMVDMMIARNECGNAKECSRCEMSVRVKLLYKESSLRCYSQTFLPYKTYDKKWPNTIWCSRCPFNSLDENSFDMSYEMVEHCKIIVNMNTARTGIP